MTVFDFAPALWVGTAFILFALFIITEFRPAMAGCAACLISFCFSLCGCALYIQCGAFFVYLIVLSVLVLTARLSARRKPDGYAIVVKKTDCDGGLVSYNGVLYPALSRDVLYVYKRGDVCSVSELTDGTLLLTRI